MRNNFIIKDGENSFRKHILSYKLRNNNNNNNNKESFRTRNSTENEKSSKENDG